MTEKEFQELKLTDRVVYMRKEYPIDDIIDTGGGRRQIVVNGACISNPQVVSKRGDVSKYAPRSRRYHRNPRIVEIPCPACTHAIPLFDTSNEVDAHLQEKHPGWFQEMLKKIYSQGAGSGTSHRTT